MSLITWKIKKSLCSLFNSPYLKVLIFLSVVVGAAVATCEIADNLIPEASNSTLNATQNLSVIDASIYTAIIMFEPMYSVSLIILCFAAYPIIHCLLFGNRW